MIAKLIAFEHLGGDVKRLLEIYNIHSINPLNVLAKLKGNLSPQVECKHNGR